MAILKADNVTQFIKAVNDVLTRNKATLSDIGGAFHFDHRPTHGTKFLNLLGAILAQAHMSAGQQNYLQHQSLLVGIQTGEDLPTSCGLELHTTHFCIAVSAATLVSRTLRLLSRLVCSNSNRRLASCCFLHQYV